MYLVQCNKCRASATVESAADPDAAVECGCCQEGHDHAAHVRATGDATCRPVTITAMGPAAASLKASS